MNAEMLSNVVDVELIYTGTKYTLKVGLFALKKTEPFSLIFLACSGVQNTAIGICSGNEQQHDGGGGTPHDRLLPPPLGGRGQSRDLHERGGGKVLCRDWRQDLRL